MPNFFNEQLVAGDFEQITVSSTAIGFTSTKLQPTSGTYSGQSAHKIACVPEDGEVRYRNDGTSPTATVGMVLPLGETLELSGYETLSGTKFIRTAGDVILNVTYYYHL